MSACVFIGPTLAPREAAGMLDAAFLPPARQGDIYRAVSLLEPRAVGIVDGYFQSVPSVWHKEILWAIHQGVHVFGAASMGALRAAELAPFGMRGVGRIFEAYRDGALAQSGDGASEDDDEVAVVHGPAESGYIAASEAMVNIRCTLANARRAGVISAETLATLTGIAKTIFFADRSYDLILERARAAALPEPQLAALQAWLPAGRVNQKRADAVAMLGAMREFLSGDPAPARARFHFEHTTLWDRALSTITAAAPHDPEEAALLDEIRLQGERCGNLRREVLQSLIGTGAEQAAIDQVTPAPNTSAPAAPQHLEALLHEKAREHAARRTRDLVPAAIVERQMLVRMRHAEDFAKLRARAEDKRLRLGTRKDMPDVEEFSELQLLELSDWYFSRVLGTDIPDDLAECVHSWGYADLAHFHRTVFAEYVYRQMTA